MSDKQRNDNERLRKTILKQQIEYGYSKLDAEKMLHISLASYYNRLNNPDTFTRRELRILFEKLMVKAYIVWQVEIH